MGTRESLRPVALTFFFFGTFWGAWAVSAADIKAALDVSDAVFGVLFSVALLGAAGVNAVAGSLTERWGTGAALARSLAAWAALLTAAAFVEPRVAFGVLFIGVVALGGAVDVVMNIVATAAFARRPGELVRMHALFNGGAAAGALATAVVLRSGLSWRWIWCAIALAAFLLAVAAARGVLPAGAVGERHGLLQSFRSVWREGLLLLAIVFAISAMVEGGIDTWGVLYLREDLETGLLVGAGAYVIAQVVATAARLTLGPAAGALGAGRGVTLGAGLAAAGLTFMAIDPPGRLAALGLLVAAAGISVCWPLLLARATAEQERPALVVGGVTSIGYLGFVLGPAVVGLIAGSIGLRFGLLGLAVGGAVVALAPAARAGSARASAVSTSSSRCTARSSSSTSSSENAPRIRSRSRS
jgi:MFS family permease